MDLKVECVLPCTGAQSEANENGVSTSSDTDTADVGIVPGRKQAIESRLPDTIVNRKTIQGVYTGALLLVGNVWCNSKEKCVDSSARMVMSKPCGVLQHFRFLRNIAERQTHAVRHL